MVVIETKLYDCCDNEFIKIYKQDYCNLEMYHDIGMFERLTGLIHDICIPFSYYFMFISFSFHIMFFVWTAPRGHGPAERAATRANMHAQSLYKHGLAPPQAHGPLRHVDGALGSAM